VLDRCGHFIVVSVDIFRKVETMSTMAEETPKRARRSFTETFKAEAVRLSRTAVNIGYPLARRGNPPYWPEAYVRQP
jgi:hypothetical protein